MKTFLRKFLGIDGLEQVTHQLNRRVLHAEVKAEGLERELSDMKTRHTRLQSQMITYSLQQRAREAACDVSNTIVYSGSDGDSDYLKKAIARSIQGAAPTDEEERRGHRSIRETLTNTITDRALRPVSEPLPVDHPKTVEQAQRNRRYAPARFCTPLDVNDPDAVWRTLRDQYDNFSPVWFAHELVTFGQLRMRVYELAKELNVQARPVRNAYRSFTSSWPAPLMIRAQFQLHNEAVLNLHAPK